MSTRLAVKYFFRWFFYWTVAYAVAVWWIAAPSNTWGVFDKFLIIFIWLALGALASFAGLAVSDAIYEEEKKNEG